MTMRDIADKRSLAKDTERICPRPVFCAFYKRELETLYQVSQLLARSLNLRETAREVLKLLHDEGRLHYGMIGLIDDESGDLEIVDVHQDNGVMVQNVRYQAGEGVVGSILQSRETIVVPRVADEPRFLDKLGLYDPEHIIHPEAP